MSLRRNILATGETYHVFNKTGYDIPLFRSKRDYSIFLEATGYYLQLKPPIRFSIYRKSRNKYPIDLSKKPVSIICYCLMPNHFHFILRQESEEGIKKFIQRLCNSYSHYLNTKNETSGRLFNDNFKAVRIENDEQLVHLSRYIHLNPVTSYLVEDPEKYPFSSYLIYLGKENQSFLEPKLVTSQFKTPSEYKNFVLGQKDYQRELEKIKHLTLE